MVTAISPLEYFPPECARAGLAALALAIATRAAAAPLPELSVSIGALYHPDFQAEGIALRMPGRNAEAASLDLARLVVAGHEFRHARVGCGRFEYRPARLYCGRGTLVADADGVAFGLEFDLDPTAMAGRIALRAPHGGRIELSLKGPRRASLAVDELALPVLQPALPAAGPRIVGGSLAGHAEWRAGRLEFSMALTGGAFASADGSHAGEDIALALQGAVAGHDGARRGTMHAQWRRGAVYWQPFYVPAPATASLDWKGAGADLRASLALTGEGLGSLRIEAEGDWPPRSFSAHAKEADLAVLGPRFVGPWLDPAAPEAWRFGGRAGFKMDVRDGRLSAIDGTLEGFDLAAADGQTRVGPVSGRFAWHERSPASTRLRIDGARWQALAFGGFELALDSQGDAVRVAPTRIPLLDGAVVIDRASWQGGGGAVVAASGYVEPLSMAALSTALGWPRMSGVLSASVPRLRYTGHEMTIEGALVVGVFDGYVQATGLRVLEPFGVLPRLEARLEARHLDLGLLTDAYSFGHIAGRLDADVDELVLARWRPIRFDARLRSSPGDYPRRISQRAVENISALGGAGAAAAIQRSFLGLFETFGYRRIGWSCRLRGGVCEMAGLRDAAGGGYAIVEGGGIPALNVIGYNRRVDWDELVARLGAVIDANAAPEIR